MFIYKIFKSNRWIVIKLVDVYVNTTTLVVTLHYYITTLLLQLVYYTTTLVD